MNESAFKSNADKLLFCLPFAIGQKVKIKAIDKAAIIYSACIGIDGIEYRVKWWNDENQSETWLKPSELEAA